MTATQETATGSPWVVGTVTRQPGGDGTAPGSTGVAIASSAAGQPEEGETGPDCGIIWGVQRLRGERGERERGAPAEPPTTEYHHWGLGGQGRQENGCPATVG